MKGREMGKLKPDGQGDAPGQEKPTDGQGRPAPFATFPDERSFARRMEREARKRLNEAAKGAGFDDWEHLQGELGSSQRQAPVGGKSPAKAGEDGARLRLALQVAGEMNLPATLVARLQGETFEEMSADARTLLELFSSQGQRPPAGGIPPAPAGGRPTTFTQAQLRDPRFVREHKDEIMQAARDGRIVRS